MKGRDEWMWLLRVLDAEEINGLKDFSDDAWVFCVSAQKGPSITGLAGGLINALINLSWRE